MQAVDQRLGGTIPVLKATDQNLSYAFEGDWDVYENECKRQRIRLAMFAGKIRYLRMKSA